MKNTLLLFYFAFIPFFIFGQTVISKDIESQFQLENEVDCIIQLTNQWSVPDFVSSWTKDEKTQFVFSNLLAFAENEQKELIEYLLAQDIDYKSYYVFNGFQAKLTSMQLSHILNHFEIASVSYNKSTQQYFPRDENLSQRMPTEWGIQKIMADSVWNLGFEGAEVVVAGQDTGYDFDNPLINQKYRGFNNDTYDHQYNWHDAIHELNPLHDDPDDNPMNNPCGLDSPIPCDDNGHGTHTMGTMVGQDADNGIGVAPKASWISCRNMDRGWGKPSTYTECFEWFLAPTDLNNENPDPSKSPHVINNSWGCPEIEGCNSDNWIFMETVVNNLVDAGIVVVVSAGNDGNSGCNSINRPPSMFERTFAVGASAQNDTIAGFSSYGPVTADGSNRWKPDVVAPGVGVRSITLDDFGTWSGTSMAGPHVAGAVALIISANPALAGQVDEIQTILKNTARHLTDTITCQGISADQVPNFRYGYGRINVFEAVKEALLTVKTNEIEEKGLFYLYPNPVENVLFIGKASDFESQSKISYEIYSNTGAKALTGAIVNQKINNIDVSNLANGIYYLRCKTSNQTSVLTFVKQ